MANILQKELCSSLSLHSATMTFGSGTTSTVDIEKNMTIDILKHENNMWPRLR